MAAEVYDPLFDLITPDCWVLTPNRRLARVLHSAYNQYQMGRHPAQSCWQAPSIMAWADGLELLWSRACASVSSQNFPQLNCSFLSDDQALAIWQRLLAEHTAQWQMLKPESLAAAGYSAWQNLKLWGLKSSELDLSCEETQVFKLCAQQFDDQLKRLGMLSSAQVPSLLCEFLRSGLAPLPMSIRLTGFDDINPAQEGLLECLRERGSAVDFFEPQCSIAAQMLPCADQDEELALAASWAKQQIEQHPQHRVGLVIPDLPQRKQAVERVLTQVFAPQDWQLDHARHAPGYNISVAEPLGFTPPIAAAFQLLSLMQGQPEVEAWLQFTMNNFFGAEAETSWRAQLLARVRHRYYQITWRRLLAATEAFKGSVAAPIWYQSITATLAWRRSVPRGKLPISRWVGHWQALLALWHWPGERSLDTLEYQQLMQWPVLLADVKQLETIVGPLTFAEALSHLTRLSYRPFAAQTGDSPLQVLGLLEAAGQPFDALWVLGMDGRQWPPAAEPNPLLPIKLQRELNMPRSSSNRELMLARRLTQRLCQAAPTVVVSYSLRDGDRPLVPSPLIEQLPPYSGPSIVPPLSLALQLKTPATHELEAFRDDQGPALTAAQEGGVQVLKTQAGCPFAAFARHRLNANNPQPLVFGVNPGLRGSLLHAVLFRLWQHWQTQSTLLGLSEQQITTAIDEALTQAWLDVDPYLGIAPTLRAIENLRSHQIINALLEQDRQRPGFAVAELESQHHMQLGNLRLKLRLDRVDQLDAGGKLVIDYKSRESSHQVWLDERPEEPQVPLYCLLTTDVVGGVFGQLEPGKEGYVGLIEEGRCLLSVKSAADLNRPEMPDWQALLALWQHRLEHLADEFCQGQAVTTPSAKTCRYCDLKSLCRYPQRSIGPEAVNADEEHSYDV